MPPKKKARNGQLRKDLLDSEHLKAVKEEFGQCVVTVLQRRHTGELATALERVVFER